MTESDWQVIAEEAAAVAMRAGMLPGGMGRALQQTGRGEQQSVCQGRSLNVKRLKAFWRTRGASATSRSRTRAIYARFVEDRNRQRRGGRESRS
jgi:hypothetical protein